MNFQPDIAWFKADVQIAPNNPQYKMESYPDGTQKLTLFNVKKEDAGADIRCTATNKWGDVWSDATLTVQSRPS